MSPHPSAAASNRSSARPADPTQLGEPGFVQDPRVYMDRVTGTWRFEDDDEEGTEMEWDAKKRNWVPVIDEDLVRAQQAAYSVQGVDESAPAAPVLAREKKKRKKEQVDYTSGNTTPLPPAKKTKPEPKRGKNTAVYVSSIPLDATKDEIIDRFGKFGVLEEEDEGEPKVKMYADEEGLFNGTALVVYFKEESVTLAITMLDEAELRIGEGGSMRVELPNYDNDKWKNKREAKVERKVVDKSKASRRLKRMEGRIAEWDDEDGFGPQLEKKEPLPAPLESRVVVLKHMFTLDQLASDPSLLLDLKEDVREECEALGQVTNVILYDKEPEGVMTVKFRDPVSAQACVLKMNGRYFDKRRVLAELYTGRQRFKRTGDDITKEVDEAEKQRLDEFAAWLMAED
ncbi:splicing factor u2af-associated protein 2 [Dacryopinax primogenitus]|uniref:Splicing factor u2af-associated protein 2 n=1 Tax=Dacryopinax primogenitus (strain DJM 731) TaxID=1858805 RepID=M5GFN7_DACPD|nr:splicing factor u2af-associated protein 2 [Dacryopinax primogenitus]EJU04273.1 splicing factor u2af-associated protein 2 [Dacryopinax primogenitus]